jgi:murein DD-endopeptidase MepM/ murein hydrolase activator NlpD
LAKGTTPREGGDWVPVKTRLTILVIPETGKRSRTLHLSKVWLAVPLLLVLVLASALAVQYRTNQTMRQGLAELETLRRANRQQQAALEAMQSKADATAEKLADLEALEQQIKELTNQGTPSRGGSIPGAEKITYAGRGGPTPEIPVAIPLPTLRAFFPEELRSHLLGIHDNLPLNLAAPRTAQNRAREVLDEAEQTQNVLDQESDELDRLALALADGKKTLAEHLDFLKHRPTGFPVSGGVITDRFGWRWSPFGEGMQRHEGVDLAQSYWTPIAATAQGVVVHAGWKSGGYGNTVIIDHGYGFETWYGHMIDIKVNVGDTVERGQVVGWVGSTGLSTGPHVHYEVHVDGVALDPLQYAQ